jgi:hypothetical protein
MSPKNFAATGLCFIIPVLLKMAYGGIIFCHGLVSALVFKEQHICYVCHETNKWKWMALPMELKAKYKKLMFLRTESKTLGD